MKKLLLGTASFSTLSIMIAGLSMAPLSNALADPAVGQNDGDIAAINREIAKLRAENDALRQRDALRQENSALRERERLRQENAALRGKSEPVARRVPAPTAARAAIASAPISPVVPAAPPQPLVPVASRQFDLRDPTTLMDYAGDGSSSMFKAAPPIASPGVLTLWADGGATFANGDPMYNFYPGNSSFLTPLGGGGLPGYFSFVPKVGWEAAAGFDYRLPNSQWHVSGQFRYGDNRTSAGPVGTSASFALPVSGGPATVGSSASASGTEHETHWLSDFTIGREFGVGQSAVQVKGGVRFAEVTAETTTNSLSKLSISGIGSPIPTLFGGTTTSITETSKYTSTLNSRFVGAGPVLGAQGKVPIWGSWTFDYLADTGLLYGTSRIDTTTRSNLSINPIPSTLAFYGFGGGFTSGPFATSRRFWVVNPDFQAGFSYWVTPRVAVSVSYRLDAYIGALLTEDVSGKISKTTRYYHGPHLTVSASF